MTSTVRRVHRWVATAAAAFLLYIAITGGLLALDNLAVAVTRTPGPQIFPSPAKVRAAAQPIPLADLPAMLDRLREAVARSLPGVPIRALQVRYFGTMPQGVVITNEADPRQIAFDLRSGVRVGFDAPGYPHIRFLFPWHVHEDLKRLHRGDMFGITGRAMDWFCGVALLALAASGLLTYADMYRRRGRPSGPP